MDTLTRAGLLGDIHAEDRALETALEFLRAEGVDAVLAVGDVCDGRGDLDRCCSLLASHEVHVVRGNHDRWLLNDQLRTLADATPTGSLSDAARAYLAALPATRRFVTPAGELLLCHGLGTNDMERVDAHTPESVLLANPTFEDLVNDPALRFVVDGHTHRRMVRTVRALTLINAGTLFREHDPCFLLADFAAREVRCFAFDGPGSVRAAEVHRLPG